VFNVAGYALRPLQELPYPIASSRPTTRTPAHGHRIFDLVYDLDQTTGHVPESTASNGMPYTVLGYWTGAGERGALCVDPRGDVVPRRRRFRICVLHRRVDRA
jgi:hypothetical protein